MLKQSNPETTEFMLLKKLKVKNISEKSRLLIVYSSRYDAYVNLMRSTQINFFWIITLILIIFPFSKKILKKRYQRGF
jgi:hypothetical protein